MNKYLIIFANTVFGLTLFPYITPFKNSFDLQPWAFIAGFVFLFVFFWHIKKSGEWGMFIASLPKPLVAISIVSVYAGCVLLVGLISGNSTFVFGLRALFSYASVLIFTLFGLVAWRYVKVEVFFVSLGLWFMSAMAQLVWGISATSSVLSRLSAGGNRGVTALASEPAFYASFCAALIVLNEIFYKEKRYSGYVYIFVFLLLIVQITLSYAGVGLMIFLLLVCAKLINLFFVNEGRVGKLLTFFTLGIVLFVLGVFYINPRFENTRGGEIFKQAVSSPKAFTSSSPSVSYRLFNPILGIYGGIIETYGVGFGIGAKEVGVIPDWLAKIHGGSRSWGGRIEGGLPGTVYELGLMGAIYSLLITFVYLKSVVSNINMRGAFMVGLFLVLLPFALFGSIAFPLFGLIIGVQFYHYKRLNQ